MDQRRSELRVDSKDVDCQSLLTFVFQKYDVMRKCNGTNQELDGFLNGLFLYFYFF